ncbi:hypothetical protein FH972_024827 [Carpinus fangiana]|uniref:Uncharacterized protein n=1 Tax=Carpinus fangiana TaxID=176857 RepID=A0A5N6KZ86_9ROSI|nr:hypothetical protein FH972_024827 [Carpinus fangiana]
MKEEEKTTCGKEMKSFEECVKLLNGFYTSKEIEEARGGKTGAMEEEREMRLMGREETSERERG